MARLVPPSHTWRVQELGLSVAVVARRLGMAPATLRTWARRYGLGPTGHQAGLHRRYTEGDVERLAAVRRLILAGQTPSEAARRVAGEPVLMPVRHGGGRALALSPEDLPAEEVVRGLAAAALALDHEAIATLLQEQLQHRGTIALWQEVVVPVLVALGERWARTGAEIEVEHTLSESLIEVLAARVREVVDPVNATPVLLASADEEQHSLPLYALGAALAEEGVRTRLVGARTPPAALAAAVRRTGPAAVFIWSQMRSTGSAAQLEHFPSVRPAPQVVIGGPGWDLEAVPTRVVWAGSLDQAVTVILESMGQSA